MQCSALIFNYIVDTHVSSMIVKRHSLNFNFIVDTCVSSMIVNRHSDGGVD